MEDIAKKLEWLKLQGETWSRIQDDKWETYRRNMQEIWGARTRVDCGVELWVESKQRKEKKRKERKKPCKKVETTC